jgi:endonuclease/exonuclease/phosphatase family metal-dependent hydrolase
MRLMTFNIRFENDRDGANAWLLRRELVAEVVCAHAPRVLGTQEGTASQLDYLRSHLPGYSMHAPDRVWDETCQYPTLFYRHDALEVVDGGEFWLSTTPQVHRSKDWDSAFPRMMSYARLREQGTSREFWAVVTHLDHLGAEARMKQGEMICTWWRGRPAALVVMGDFNEHPGSPLHRRLTADDTGLCDSWSLLRRPEDDAAMTHHGFSGVPGKGRIDWILVNSSFRVRDAFIVRDGRDGRFPSDHFPYCVDLSWV